MSSNGTQREESSDDSTVQVTESPLSGSTKLWAFLQFSSVMCVLIAVVLGLLIALVKYPQTVGLYILLPYYLYILVANPAELHDGCRWEWLTRYSSLTTMGRRFLRLDLQIDHKLAKAQAKPGAQFVFALFPHGTNADFRPPMDGMLFDALPGVAAHTRTLAATVLFRIPLVRELALWTGCVDARRSVAEKLLCNGQSFVVLPGGQAEQIRTIHGREIVYLQHRKGFLRLAMKHDVPVVPAYVFGASDYYYTWSLGHDFRLWLVKKLGISIPLAWGLYGSTLCPLPVKTTIVFGEPLYFEVSQTGSPSVEEVDAAHKEFVKALRNLFDSHKAKLGYGDRQLEIQ